MTGLFVPCYINQFYPQVGIATLELLERLGIEVAYPVDQACCGQPLANSGMEQAAIPMCQKWVHTFAQYKHIVVPSASCAYHIRHHYDVLDQDEAVQYVRSNTWDLTEFLLDVCRIEELNASFPYKVGIHQSCHGLRGLRLASSSERVEPPYSKWTQLLRMVKDIELIDLDRQDECCGFGGTFATTEAAISAKMGKDRLSDHQRNGAEVICSGDSSCLMHLEGLAKRQKSPMRFMHLAEILNTQAQ